MNNAELVENARQVLTLFGPRVSAAQDEDFTVRKCDLCEPPPREYSCYICGFTTVDKWRYKLHVDLNPKWCQDYAERWARNYAANG